MNSKQLIRYRKEFRKKVIPSYYSGKLHFLFFFSFSILFCSYLFFQIEFSLSLFLTFILTIFWASISLFWLHSLILHKKVVFFGWAFKMHHWHHTFYITENMEYDSIDDIYMLLMPPWLQTLYYTIYIPLIVFLLDKVLPQNHVYTVAFALSLWYFMYETVHFVSHLDKKHALMRIKFFKFMRRHHIMHHHPDYKDQCNFGVTEPTMDYLFRTKR